MSHPLVEIGLTDLPKSGCAMAQPAHPGTTGLLFTRITVQKNESTGLSSLGVLGVPWHTQILADQLTLFQPRGTDYAHLITSGTPGFSDLPTALS